ncbi:hypothetical protein J2847_005800 [Azospirillum agricola]|uniref:hypothetical protein n=1 Tax=Azospirillum agricola TaxID=1720247 RepID=UPI001AE3603F|nr:hypothetical protein [Azospirillum agricola]MBP2232471.1 hypothetical protein [Azospirillum agricola]
MSRSISMRLRPGSLTLREATAVARKRIKDGLYLIKRHGGWFRPKAQGYTRDLAEAGIFNATTARGYIDVEGLSVWPVSAIAEQVATDIADTERKLVALRSLQARVATSQAEDA